MKPSLTAPIIGLVFSPVVTYAMYTAAIDIQSGGDRHFSGRHAAFKNLIYSLGGALGTMGSLVVGGIATALMVLWLSSVMKRRRMVRSSAVLSSGGAR